MTYLTHLWGLYFLLLVGFAIFKYCTCNLETLYIGISKFIDSGPISFLHSEAVGFVRVILAIR